MNSIGRRLKYFRTQRKASQMDVEVGIDAAFGSVSKIESAKLTPLEETVEKIISKNIINFIFQPW